jgi:hypothetical protein
MEPSIVREAEAAHLLTAQNSPIASMCTLAVIMSHTLPSPKRQPDSAQLFFDLVLGVRARDLVPRLAQHDTCCQQMRTNRDSFAPDAGLFSKVVGQALQGPQRIGLSKTAWPPVRDLEQLLVVLRRHLRCTRSRRISQAGTTPSAK